MKVGKLILTLVILLISSLSIFAAQKYDYSNLKAGEDYVSNEVVIKFSSATKIKQFSDAQNILNKLDKDEKELRKITKSYNEVPYGTNYIYQIKYKKNIDVVKKIEQLSKHKEIEYAEPNLIYHVQLTPNDPLFSPNAWHLYNYGQSGGLVDADIDAPEAWDITTGSSSIRIGILDTGVNYTHPDLASKVDILPDADALETNTALQNCDSGNGEDCDGTPGNDLPFDVHSHGTEVAGVAAASTNNGIGVSGVCWNCRIVPIKICFRVVGGGSGCSSTDLIRGIDVGVNNELDILSISSGSLTYDNLVEMTIDNAYANGIIIVAAAGNNNANQLFYPAAYSNVVGVAATNRTDNKWLGSNYANWIDISAPGAAIQTTYLNKPPFYNAFSGTSFSAPIVSGILGLMLSQNPSLTNSQLRDILLNNTDNIDALNPTQCGGSSCAGLIGRGRANAYKAVLDALPSPPILNPIGNKIVNENSLLSFTLTASDANLDPLTFSKDNSIGNLDQNTGLFTWTPSTIDIGNYPITFSVNDYDLIWPSQSDSELINIKVNDIPSLDLINNIVVNENDIVTITANAIDIDDTPSYSINDSRFSQNNNIFTWQTDYEDSGVYYVRITASDPTSSVYQDVKITVNNVNRAPIIDNFNPIDNSISIREGDSILFTQSSHDPDNDQINFKWYFDNIFISSSSSWNYISNYYSAGSHIVRLDVSDNSLITSHSWDINIANRDPPSYPPRKSDYEQI